MAPLYIPDSLKCNYSRMEIFHSSNFSRFTQRHIASPDSHGIELFKIPGIFFKITSKTKILISKKNVSRHLEIFMITSIYMTMCRYMSYENTVSFVRG